MVKGTLSHSVNNVKRTPTKFKQLVTRKSNRKRCPCFKIPSQKRWSSWLGSVPSPPLSPDIANVLRSGVTHPFPSLPYLSLLLRVLVVPYHVLTCMRAYGSAINLVTLRTTRYGRAPPTPASPPAPPPPRGDTQHREPARHRTAHNVRRETSI
jgi:hypothetical protein